MSNAKLRVKLLLEQEQMRKEGSFISRLNMRLKARGGFPRRMVSSGMLRRVALVRTDVSEEPLSISSQPASAASYS
jgi:ABC-type transport system involved in cytochrome c biogenesis ATPase subunit